MNDVRRKIGVGCFRSSLRIPRKRRLRRKKLPTTRTRKARGKVQMCRVMAIASQSTYSLLLACQIRSIKVILPGSVMLKQSRKVLFRLSSKLSMLLDARVQTVVLCNSRCRRLLQTFRLPSRLNQAQLVQRLKQPRQVLACQFRSVLLKTRGSNSKSMMKG